MKTKSRLIILLATLACIAAPLRLLAQFDQGHWYFKADLGANWTQDADLKEFFGVESPGGKVRFDPGIRAGFGGGYNFTDWFATEFEMGVMQSWIRSMTDATQVHDASFANVPFMVNVKFQWPNTKRFIPYIGGGIGGSAAIIDVDEIDLNGVSLHGSESTAVFAYQGFAGLKFQIDRQMTVGVEYHYFGTDDPSWEAHDFFGGVPPSDTMRFGHIQTHSFSAVFHYTF
ncbi:MAG: hypothetical protein C5B50_25400 [Verrucomicrobia bacterium]|nr:MAG: hypothetical protein C5B50_25400 [Verrucomicrobiota bacterium]